MGRRYDVTRTEKFTEVELLCLDLVEQKPINKVELLSGTFDDKAQMLKCAKKMYETDVLSICSVVSSKEVEEMRGMTKAQWLQNSIKLNPETRKPFDDGSEKTEE